MWPELVRGEKSGVKPGLTPVHLLHRDLQPCKYLVGESAHPAILLLPGY